MTEPDQCSVSQNESCVPSRVTSGERSPSADFAGRNALRHGDPGIQYRRNVSIAGAIGGGQAQFEFSHTSIPTRHVLGK
jgi:hypothetical protein